VLDDSGNIFVAGRNINDSVDCIVVKFSSSGNIDTSFGNAGVACYDSGGNEYVYDMAMDDSGNVYIGGCHKNASYNDDVIVLKYTASGVLDQTLIYDGGQNDRCRDLLIDGSYLYITGESADADWYYDYIILRYDKNSLVLDATFGVDGIVTYNSAQYRDDVAYGIAVDLEGNIFVTGQAYDGTTQNIVTIKYDSSGAIDTTFGTEGIYTYDSGDNDYAYGIAVDYSGNVYVTGVDYAAYDCITIKNAP
jgi:uncharacterized delta-60 repeat protein